jgi:hypothetical protein
MPKTWKKFSEELPPVQQTILIKSENFPNPQTLFFYGLIVNINYWTNWEWLEIPTEPLYTLEEVKEKVREALIDGMEMNYTEMEINKYLNQIK